MPRIVIPDGSARDGSTLMYVNGDEALVPDGVETEVDDKFVTLLDDIGISYNVILIASGEMNAVSGSYTLNGEPCEIGDIIDLSHADGTFDPLVDVDAEGIKPSALYLKEPLLSQVLTGYTIVLEANFDSGEGTSTQISASMADWPEYNFGLGGAMVWNEASEIDNVSLSSTLSGTSFPDKFGTGGVHKVAITATAEGMAISVDGQAADTVAEPGIDPTATAFYFAIGNDPDARIRSFAFYEPVDDADLPNLSALT